MSASTPEYEKYPNAVRRLIQLEDERNKRRLESINLARKYVDGCKSCELIKARNGFGPDHDASEGCESGWYKHCSCDVCF